MPLTMDQVKALANLVSKVAPVVNPNQGTLPQGQVSPAITPQARPSALPTDIASRLPAAASAVGPSLTGVPSNAGPASMPYPKSPTGEFGTEFGTKGGKNAAIVAGAIQNITDAVTRFKQQSFQKEAAQAQAIISRYIALKQAEESSPELKGTAEKMLMDPKINKIIQKALKDPMSGAYNGIQAGYNAAMQKEAANQKMQEMFASMQKAMADAQKAQATVPQTQDERDVAMGTKPDANAQLRAQTDLKIAQMESAKRGYTVSVSGLSPAVKGPDGKMYTWDDVKADMEAMKKDPNYQPTVPGDAQRVLMAEHQTTMAQMDYQSRKAQQAQESTWDRMMASQRFQEVKQARAALRKDWDPAISADFQYDVMKKAAEDIRKNPRDQQAMVLLLSNHIALTLGLAKGARITMTHWKEAEASAPWLARIQARFGGPEGSLSGFMTGTVLAEGQVNQIVNAGAMVFNTKAEQAARMARLDSEQYDVPYKPFDFLNKPPKGVLDGGKTDDKGGKKGGSIKLPSGIEITIPQ